MEQNIKEPDEKRIKRGEDNEISFDTGGYIAVLSDKKIMRTIPAVGKTVYEAKNCAFLARICRQ